MEDQERKKYSYEGGDGIVGAGACGSEDPLRIDVVVNSEPVGYEAQQKHHGDGPGMEYVFPDDKSYYY